MSAQGNKTNFPELIEETRTELNVKHEPKKNQMLQVSEKTKRIALCVFTHLIQRKSLRFKHLVNIKS